MERESDHPPPQSTRVLNLTPTTLPLTTPKIPEHFQNRLLPEEMGACMAQHRLAQREQEARDVDPTDDGGEGAVHPSSILRSKSRGASLWAFMRNHVGDITQQGQDRGARTGELTY